MADGINGLTGYGIGSNFYSQNRTKQETEEKKDEVVVNNNKHREIDPNEVMDFLSANNFYIANTTSVNYVTDPATEARIASSMKDFEFIYGLIVNEFGEENADVLMDMVMDKLLGINY